MIDEDGIMRPDNPHAHVVVNKLLPIDKHIDEYYRFVNKNFFFKLWASFIRKVGIIVMAPYIKFKYKLRVIGKENIKKVNNQGVIITINHVHPLDNIIVGANILKHRKCYFITLKQNIEMPVLGGLLKTLGGIPIPSTLKAMPAFEDSINKILAKNKALLVCPEASLWPYYRKIRPFKRGAFRFAVTNNAPILPIVILFRRKPKLIFKKRKKYKYYFTAQVGAPIYTNNDLKTNNEKVKELQNQTHNFYTQSIDNFYKNEPSFQKNAE